MYSKGFAVFVCWLYRMFLFFSITVLALLWPDSPLAFYTLSCSRRATCCSLMSSSLPLSIRFVRTKRLTVNYGIREYNIPWNHHCLRGSNVCGFRGSMNLHVYPHEHTYKHLFFKYLFKLSLPTKLRPYNEESFGYPQTLPPPPSPWMKMIPHHNLVVQVQSYEFDSKNGNTFNNNFRDFIWWDFLMIIRIIFVTCFYNCIFLCLRYTAKFCKKK